MAQASKAAYDRDRENDLEAFLARKRTEKAAWTARNQEKVAISYAKTIAKAKSEGRYKCDDCNLPMASSSALKGYKASAAHALQVALNSGAVRTKTPSQATLRARRFAINAKKSKTLLLDLRPYCQWTTTIDQPHELQRPSEEGCSGGQFFHLTFLSSFPITNSLSSSLSSIC
jgi:hypothetical protein